MKRFLISVIFVVFILSLSLCCSTTNNQSITIFQELEDYVGQMKKEDISNTGILEKVNVDEKKNTASSEEIEMKLFINDIEIPVIWEENDTVAELMKDVSKEDIVVLMSMYGDFEQVGSLGKKYLSDDKQIMVDSGDIVLYNNSNIVLFYASNAWSYTRLGKMDLSKNEVVDLLSNGNITIRISR